MRLFLKLFNDGVNNKIMAFRAHWSQNLLEAMKDPSLQLITNDLAIVIKDKYPKAQHHFLVLPHEEIEDIFELTKDHLSTLEEMRLLADNVIEIKGLNKDNFNIGFHARPSMRRLHLHVISKDFNSPALKTKHHWNTFNTSIFVKYELVLNEIMNNGFYKRWEDEKIKDLLSLPLKCNSCNYIPKHMPDLKQHLLKHC